MDSPTSGTIKIDGKDISNYNKNELTEYRADTVYYQKNYIEKFGIINLSS